MTSNNDQDHIEDDLDDDVAPVNFTDDELKQLFRIGEGVAGSDDATTGPDYDAAIRALALYADQPTDANYESAHWLLDSLNHSFTVDLANETAVAHMINQLPSAISSEREEIISALKRLVARRSPTVTLGSVAPKRLQWLIEGWLPVGEIGLFAGARQLGKSTLAIQLANAISGGTPCFAKPSSPRAASLIPNIEPDHRGSNTLIIGWEHDADEASRRLSAIRNAFGDDISDGAPHRIHYKDASGLGPAWGRAGGRFGQLAQTRFCREIRAEAEALQAALLVLDPVAAAFGGDENNRSEIREFLDDWSIWAKRTGVAVMFIGHTPKSASQYNDLSAWNVYVQYLWTLKPGGTSDHSKHEDANGRRAALRLEKSVSMPEDPRGREIPLEFDTRRDAAGKRVSYALRECSKPKSPQEPFPI